jgi:hypothetical protein
VQKRVALEDTTGADTNNPARLLQILLTDVGIQVFYFSSPPAYRGSRIGSYGSSIKYNITYYGDVAAGNLQVDDPSSSAWISGICLVPSRLLNPDTL